LEPPPRVRLLCPVAGKPATGQPLRALGQRRGADRHGLTCPSPAPLRFQPQPVFSAPAQFLSNRTGKVFEALVTGASEKGSWVRLLQRPLEDKLTTGQEGAKVGDQIRFQPTCRNIE
jgi:hypothetical protein